MRIAGRKTDVIAADPVPEGDRGLASLAAEALGDGTLPMAIALIVPDNLDIIGYARGAPPLGALSADLLRRLGASHGTENIFITPDGKAMLIRLHGPELASACTQITSRLAELPFLSGPDGGSAFGMTARAGLVHVEDPSTADPVEIARDLLLALADARLSDRSLVIRESADQPDLERSGRILQLLSDLPAAMRDARLTLLAQEIVDLSGKVPGRQFEVLLRLRDTEGSGQQTSTFIHWAERSSLIERIDHWVMHSVLVEHAEALRARPDLSFSINVSARSLGDPGLADRIATLFAEGGVAPARIQLEVTETSAIRDLGVAAENLRRLRALGCRIALDDFGAGLSGYSYLKAFAPDTIKIDGTLVTGIADPSSPDHMILRSIVMLAQQLGIQVIAEHVSSAEILQALRDLDVTAVQGFHLGQPQPLLRVLDCPVRAETN